MILTKNGSSAFIYIMRDMPTIIAIRASHIQYAVSGEQVQALRTFWLKRDFYARSVNCEPLEIYSQDSQAIVPRANFKTFHIFRGLPSQIE